jgi:pimeloyl-ACP methyl ester carboxylesterase
MKNAGLNDCCLILLLLFFFALTPLHAATSIKQTCSQKIELNLSGVTLQIPCCYNYSPAEPNPAIERVVSVIHGKSRTANNSYDSVLQSALKADQVDKKTMILAPQFFTKEDMKALSLPGNSLFWTESGWKQGDDSLPAPQDPRPVKISSFEVIDRLLDQLADRSRFPNLKQMIIAGHSAGGQFVNRYAAGNRGHDIFQALGIRIRYLVANPSSYLYFDGQRRVAKSPVRFAVPPAGTCRTYNRYKYGLESLNPYMARTGAEQIRKQYPEREVIYLLGTEDDGPHGADLDQSCGAMAQGLERMERGRIYYNYLLQYFERRTVGKHKLVLVPKTGHSAEEMFNSDCGLFYLFDYRFKQGDCPEP